jgi:CRISPR-associated protein Cas1
MKNLHELPKFSDKLSYLYVEHAVIEQAEKAIAVHDVEGTTPVPAASLAVLVLGPGTSITHAAVRALGENNCQIIWSGEQGVRFYAHGLGGARHSRNIRQARLVSDDIRRLQVVVRMYTMRFAESVDGNMTLQQLRGREGVRVRQAYADASRSSGVPWEGRNYQRKDWGAADPVNRALSAANACLYGIVHAAILSGGYSPALGFIHTGKQLSFVYDIADLYKAQFVIPAAFEAAKNPADVERRVRLGCRDAFAAQRLIERILPDIRKVLDIPEVQAAQEDEFADDEARPSELWQPGGISADTPISQILELKPPLPDEGTDHGDSDSGTGHDLSPG